MNIITSTNPYMSHPIENSGKKSGQASEPAASGTQAAGDTVDLSAGAKNASSGKLEVSCEVKVKSGTDGAFLPLMVGIGRKATEVLKLLQNDGAESAQAEAGSGKKNYLEMPFSFAGAPAGDWFLRVCGATNLETGTNSLDELLKSDVNPFETDFVKNAVDVLLKKFNASGAEDA